MNYFNNIKPPSFSLFLTFPPHRITKTNNDTQWALSTESKQSKFQCGGQCVVVKDPAANVTVHDEVVVKGKVDEGQGKGEKELGVGAQEGFCFITRARSWTGSGGFYLIFFFFFGFYCCFSFSSPFIS